MGKLKKTLVIAIAAAMLLQLFGITTAFAATDVSDGDFDCNNLTDTTVCVVDYTGPGGTVTIPTMVYDSSAQKNKAVTKINATAFQNDTNITSLLIPASVAVIDSGAFSGCTHLESVTFAMGSRLTQISASAFSGCTSLKSVTFDSSSLIAQICDNAFENTALTSIKIPVNVTSIGADAFKGCGYLASVAFETAKIETIGAGAFAGAPLTSIYIPASVTTIGVNAFKGCSKLAALTFAAGSAIKTIDDGAFYGTALSYVSIPSGIDHIGAEAFIECPNLYRVILPSMDVTIETGAFVSTQTLQTGGIYGYDGSTVKDFCFNAVPVSLPFHPLELAVGTPVITSALTTGAGKVTLTWSEPENAMKYDLFRSTSSTGTYTRVSPETGLTDPIYTDAGLTQNTTYYYKVVAYCEVGGEKYYGVFSSPVGATPLLPAPSSLSVQSTGYNSLKLSWTPVVGASGYQVYRSYTLTGTYTVLKTVTVSSTTTTAVTPMTCSVTGVTTGKVYYYKVRAYKATTTGTGRTAVTTKTYGAFTGIASGYAVPSPVTNLTVTVDSPTSLKLKWSSVSGKPRYEIWRKGPGENEYSLYPVTTAYTYFTNDNSVVFGQEYSFKVRAYRVSGGVKYYGDFSSEVKKATEVLKVPGVKAARYNSTAVRITWSSLKGVSGYKVYCSTSSSGPWGDPITTTLSRSFLHTGRTTGTTYYYKVVAFYMTNNGPDSDIKPATP